MAETLSTVIEFLKVIKNEKEVNVKFTKKDGTERVMRCTLDFSVIPRDQKPKGFDAIKFLSKIQKSKLLSVYDLDKKGETISSLCNYTFYNASINANTFINNKMYLNDLPKDFYSFLTPLIANLNNMDVKRNFKAGVFYFFLEKELAKISGDFNYTCIVDKINLEKNIKNSNDNLNVLSLDFVIISGLNSKYNLSINYGCKYNDEFTIQKLNINKWATSVEQAIIETNQSQNVWDGK